MVVNKEGKLFGKLNIIDLLIILIAIAVLAYGIKPLINRKDTNSDIKITIKFEATQKEPKMFEGLKIGNAVFDHVKNMPLGTLTNFEIKPSKVISENNVLGRFDKVELPDRADAIFDIETSVKVNKADLVINKEPVKIGNRMTIRTGNVAFSGFVIGILYDEAEYRRLMENA